MRLGFLLVALTGVNVYVFFFREDTAVHKVLQPSSTGKLLSDKKAEAFKATLPKSLRGSMPAAVATATGAGVATPEPAGGGRVVEGKIGPADALVTILGREGVDAATAAAVAKALGRELDPKLIRPGDGYEVGFDAEGNLASFEYVASPVVRFIVKREGDSWRTRKEEKALEQRTVESSGVIDSSLYESVGKAGESAALVSLLVDLFAWDINFYVDTHPGDHWKVIVEKQYLGGQFYKYGSILAAEYGGRVANVRAFFFNGRYYDDKGQAVAKAMLKSPLRYVRISSKFDRRRLHPILHRVKAHLGVDYAAPVGTPVWASTGGRVVEARMKPGSGNTVVVAHAGGLQTRYYHLSRFARGLVVGRQVNQKEVIGYVGTTGLSTGPHLHFSVTRFGAFMDPNKLQVMREAPVANRGAYLEAIKPRLAALAALQAVAKN